MHCSAAIHSTCKRSFTIHKTRIVQKRTIHLLLTREMVLLTDLSELQPNIEQLANIKIVSNYFTNMDIKITKWQNPLRFSVFCVLSVQIYLADCHSYEKRKSLTTFPQIFWLRKKTCIWKQPGFTLMYGLLSSGSVHSLDRWTVSGSPSSVSKGDASCAAVGTTVKLNWWIQMGLYSFVDDISAQVSSIVSALFCKDCMLHRIFIYGVSQVMTTDADAV